MTDKPIDKEEPKKKSKTIKKDDSIDYILNHIDTMKEDIKSHSEDIDRINENSNFACEQIEELRPLIDTIRRRLGL
tara:strand:+ start:211 stop:438 length:228 start_codon:yes stop_codon:yes gene_type:complete